MQSWKQRYILKKTVFAHLETGSRQAETYVDTQEKYVAIAIALPVADSS